MRTDKYSLYDRLIQLQLLFWQHPGQAYTTREIADALGVNEDTALKDLQAMASSRRLPIVRTGRYWQLSTSVQCELRSLLVPGEGAFLLLVQKIPLTQLEEGETGI